MSAAFFDTGNASPSAVTSREAEGEIGRDDPEPDDPELSSSFLHSSYRTSSSTPDDTLAINSHNHHDEMEVARALKSRALKGPFTKAKMDEEAIAGTVVGVILGCALLLCCLYPFIVNRLRRRKKSRLSFDCEADNFRGEPPISVRRLSSSDSFKRNGTSSPPGKGKDPERNSHDAHPANANQGHYVNAALDTEMPIEPAMTIDTSNVYYPNSYSTNHHDLSNGDDGPQQYVLRGTCEDYYSPYIPSEAFGMFPQPEPSEVIPKPDRAVSRGSSLRYNVKQIFRRKSTMSSQGYSYDQNDGQHHAQGATPMQILSHEDMAESPTEVNDPSELPFSSRAPPSKGPDLHGESSRGITIESQSSYSERYMGRNSQPAPGTVNPMDIMPASSESEIFHRTDYQLYSNSYDDQPQLTNAPQPSTAVEVQPVPILSTPCPPQQLKPPTQTAPAPPSSAPPVARNDRPPPTKKTSRKDSNTSHPGNQSQAPMDNIALPNRPSNAGQSELSTPAQGTASTTTQSTPSTHMDSPSPESLNSSDYGQSASPHGLNGIPSPRGGTYSCNEPGCNQVFDQPHKLKHHQRYHSKDHKCPYPACGKGFGTKTHLMRHVNDRHEKKRKFHCSIQGCDYSRSGGKAFPRKDNWKRHMTKIHGLDHRRLPEPVEVDSEMTGT